jgi:CheY-like chemotaxis protein
MPVMTGLEVIKKCIPVYKKKQIPLPKIIFMTAVSDPGIRKVCMYYSDFFMSKPIEASSMQKVF